MKAAKTILKIAALLAAIGSLACLIAAHWETVEELFYVVVGKVKEKTAECKCFCASEFEDFED